MKLTRTRIAALASFVLLACAAAPDGNASAAEGATEVTAQDLSIIAPAATITPTQFVAKFGKPTVIAGSTSVDCGMGEVRLFAGPMPTNFIPADGRLLSISQNTALFAELLTAYGGDGRSTFAVPNLTAITPNGLAYGVCAFGTFTGNR